MPTSERDADLMKRFGLTEDEIERQARSAESEDEPDPLTGVHERDNQNKHVFK